MSVDRSLIAKPALISPPENPTVATVIAKQRHEPFSEQHLPELLRLLIQIYKT